jgi:hypothetical protein
MTIRDLPGSVYRGKATLAITFGLPANALLNATIID